MSDLEREYHSKGETYCLLTIDWYNFCAAHMTCYVSSVGALVILIRGSTFADSP